MTASWRGMSFGLALLAVLLMLPTAPDAAEARRDTLLSAQQSIPWRGVGRVNIARHKTRGMCTGTLIAPDVVLTAAHCLVNMRTGQPHRPSDIHFVAGWHKGKSSGHSKAKAVLLHPLWKAQRPTRTADLGADLALIRLARPLGPGAARPFKTGRPGLPGDPVLLISYRRDRAHALTRQAQCTYSAVTGPVLTLGCRIQQGTSGAPVFVRDGDDYRVVAVISAKSDQAPPRAFAARIDQAIDTLMERLPR